MNERNDLLQVVRAASPVLLRVIVLGAFFIYCTVSRSLISRDASRLASPHLTSPHLTSSRLVPSQPRIFPECFIFMRVVASSSDNKAFSRPYYREYRAAVHRSRSLAIAASCRLLPHLSRRLRPYNVCTCTPCANYDNA